MGFIIFAHSLLLDFHSLRISIICSLFCTQGGEMTLAEFLRKNKLLEMLDLNCIPLTHPHTKEKIYIHRAWRSGFWYQIHPGGCHRRLYSCEYHGSLLDLEIYLNAKKELTELRKVCDLSPA